MYYCKAEGTIFDVFHYTTMEKHLEKDIYIYMLSAFLQGMILWASPESLQQIPEELGLEQPEGPAASNSSLSGQWVRSEGALPGSSAQCCDRALAIPCGCSKAFLPNVVAGLLINEAIGKDSPRLQV